MKKIFILLTVCLVLLAGCTPPNQSAQGTQVVDISNYGVGSTLDNNDSASSAQISVDVEIKEKMFISQTNDIYLNAEDYLGKTIKYEGIFDSYTWEEENVTHYSIIRYGPGCCGNDGNAGFEVVWDGEYPKQGDWVEAVGVLEECNEGGWRYLRLNLVSLTVLPTRGEEYVSQ